MKKKFRITFEEDPVEMFAVFLVGIVSIALVIWLIGGYRAMELAR